MPPQVNPAGCGPTHTQSTAGTEEVKQCEPEKKQAEPQKDSSPASTTTPHRATPKEASARKAEIATAGTAQQTALNHKLKTLQSGKEKPSTTHEKSAHAKSTSTQPEGTLWDSAKNAAGVLNSGARVIGATTAFIAGTRKLEEADQHVQAGVAKAHEIAIDHRGKELAAEIKRVGSGNSTFAEKEELIKKIDAFRHEASDAQLQPLYQQESLKPRNLAYEERLGRQETTEERAKGGLTELLGPYRYQRTNDSRSTPNESLKTTQKEVLETALHNWSVTQPDVRASLLAGKNPAGFDTGWKTVEDMRAEDRRKDAKQETLQKEPYGNYDAYPTPRPRGDQTNPETAYIRGKISPLDGAFTIINALAGAEGGESKVSAESKVPGEPSGPAPAPYRGAPSEATSRWQTILETEPGLRSTPLRRGDNEPVVQQEPVAQARERRAELELNRQIYVRTPQGRETITVREYRNRVDQARQWVEAQRAESGETIQKGQTFTNRPTESQRARAAEMFGLDEDWDRVGNSNMGRNLI